jgi:hypothetical protein
MTIIRLGGAEAVSVGRGWYPWGRIRGVAPSCLPDAHKMNPKVIGHVERILT